VHELSKIHIGTCAWSFDDWDGIFYPEHLPHGDRLHFYAQHFPAVEVDSTFYAAPAPHTAGHWLDATPEEFRFAFKVPREITHERKLRASAEPLRLFLDSLAPLRRKTACVLIQLPPHFVPRTDERAFREFILELPQDFRFAVEFRSSEWHLPRIAHLLEQHRVCWVWNDITSLEEQAFGAFEFLPQTTDFLYLRLLGDLQTRFGPDGERLHRYDEVQWPRSASVESWAVKLRQHLARSSAAFVFAGNQFEGFAPATCSRFAELCGLALPLPRREQLSAGQSDGEQLKLL
jgi:uncharacterized protein YecE (DUF72 family)